ncbi:tRNA-Thr(GGU) m(6)t(6)A37 methyltransferase TsaA [Rhodobium orientis]|uniref:tRNA (N6-threonylcarbamoyladenosine(37)-N6)-methyltransferase TrmO n=1 Tax=Rhodobium orientis TaxID=34017 RepID=A0A327JMU6_9HYPH|nr:tRNA (N6-threonylcarbamoyladenosine(37)-N6)-methyltransferase TrmO [Rhodobium orientis]MBB4304883.1 tRNA-Thr(GGU) m(6)t(6)A37 methyltransferase TsaA [Rhodobium orientis]MBK5949212.1 tRNA (N6-threonylcarbamoyladenosine(37)-N6)-methyltransferase TrmO [Rhodobium orientis]RAI27381.1 tRNA (N6-threonylcarbamoyladenosine(37)-N6)-methyltransferase TrmO [Rhodobium orientis]
MSTANARPGEIALDFDPSERATDAGLVFIGRIRTPWDERSDCPRNTREALERGAIATLEFDDAYRQGLTGLENTTHLHVLYWMHQSRRDLIVQCPNHSNGAKGVFALRSPVRPNPIALAVAEVVGMDLTEGRILVRGLDCLDGTPLLDIKPYFSGIDSRPDAKVGWMDKK